MCVGILRYAQHDKDSDMDTQKKWGHCSCCWQGFNRLVFRNAKNENSFNSFNSMIKTKYKIFDIGYFMSSHYVCPFSGDVGSRNDTNM